MRDLSVPVNDPPDRQAERLSRVDGCPKCLDYNTPVDARPARLRTTKGSGFWALYWCPCGESWVTAWMDAS